MPKLPYSNFGAPMPITTQKPMAATGRPSVNAAISGKVRMDRESVDTLEEPIFGLRKV